MTTHVVLVRHGESAGNVARRITGHTDVALTDIGIGQATTVGGYLHGLHRELPFTHVWSSDLQRAVSTARHAIAGLPVPPLTLDARLREMYFGEWENRPFFELAPEEIASFRDFTSFQAPGGESTAQLMTRLTGFLDELESGHHLLFTHGCVIHSVLDAVGSPKLVPNCAVVRLDWTGRALLNIYAPGV